MIKRVLVANRAEIASRVFRTCRRLGIETVAVHSDADADLPYVREADVAVRLPGTRRPAPTCASTSSSTPRCGPGADAVHPGYGFLSENPDFARAVVEAGLTWVGPTPESIEAMGSKVEAKRIMREAGVPVLEAPAEPTEADLPLLVKASAGGGGRGMRVVRRLADLACGGRGRGGRGAVGVRGRHRVRRALRRARTPCRGPGLRQHGRSASGTARSSAVTRRCSRSPRPRVSPPGSPTRCTTRQARAAEAIGYRGAGTVEFLVRPGVRAVLVPGDEHPPPGRAPGDRAGVGRGPGRDAARSGGRHCR